MRRRVVLINLAKTQHFGEARCGSGWRQRASGGKFGCRIEDGLTEQGEDKVAAPSPAGPRMRSRPTYARCRGAAAAWPCGRLRMTVKASLGRDDRAGLEHAAQAFE